MNRIKNFIQFINEGAWYVTDPVDNTKSQAYLSVRNNSNNQTEYLKTVDSNMKNYSEKELAGFRVYYGLYPAQKFYKYPKDRQLAAQQRALEARIKDNIMDPLKKGLYKMSEGEKLSDFLNYTLAKNIDGNVNYIVRMGSSENLVKGLSEAFNEIYPDAEIIDINKIKYNDVYSAINLSEFLRKVKSELTQGRQGTSDTRRQVLQWIKQIKYQIQESIRKGEDPSFTIKSSGIKGGVRSALRPKYDTASEAFIEAVHHCVLGDSSGNLGKMIIVDDNINQGIDFRDVSHKILEILAGVIDITKNVASKTLKDSDIFGKISDSYRLRNMENKVNSELDNLLEREAKDRISKNVIGYVLYGFQTGRYESEDTDYYEIIADISRGVINELGIEGGRNTIYRSSYNKISSAIEERSLEAIRNINPDSDAIIRRKINNIISTNRSELITKGRNIVSDPTGAKYPNTSHWKVGDKLISSNNIISEIIDINHPEGLLVFKVITGEYKGRNINMDLGRLDPGNPSAPWRLYDESK